MNYIVKTAFATECIKLSSTFGRIFRGLSRHPSVPLGLGVAGVGLAGKAMYDSSQNQQQMEQNQMQNQVQMEQMAQMESENANAMAQDVVDMKMENERLKHQQNIINSTLMLNTLADIEARKRRGMSYDEQSQMLSELTGNVNQQVQQVSPQQGM